MTLPESGGGRREQPGNGQAGGRECERAGGSPSGSRAVPKGAQGGAGAERREALCRGRPPVREMGAIHLATPCLSVAVLAPGARAVYRPGCRPASAGDECRLAGQGIRRMA